MSARLWIEGAHLKASQVLAWAELLAPDGQLSFTNCVIDLESFDYPEFMAELHRLLPGADFDRWEEELLPNVRAIVDAILDPEGPESERDEEGGDPEQQQKGDPADDDEGQGE